MIDPNELKLGNYVAVKNKGNDVIGKVFAINKECVSIDGGNNNYDYHLLYPVPLTEALLLKCGFEAIDYGDKYDPDDEFAGYFEYHLNIGIFYRDLICKPSGGWYCYVQDVDMIEGNDIKTKNIYYLHELQNLYFALTGKELEVGIGFQ